MHYRILGRTGLEVSVISLGTGGVNRLGQSRWVSRRRVRQLVRRALDFGINFFDTSGAYEQSESRLGDALGDVPRDQYFLASKVFPWHKGRALEPAETRLLLERSLRRLRVECLDLMQLHRVTPETYRETRDRMMPELQKWQAEGKIRYIGITESSSRDPGHLMLNQALRDGLFDTVMLAHHPGNAAAGDRVLSLARAGDTGVIAMAAARHHVVRSVGARLDIAVRTAASLMASPPNKSRLKARLREAYSDVIGKPGFKAAARGSSGATGSIQSFAAAYRFAAAHPAIATVLTGTTDPVHLEENVRAVLSVRE